MSDSITITVDVLSLLFGCDGFFLTELEVTLPLISQRQIWTLSYDEDFTKLLSIEKDGEVFYLVTDSPFKSLIFENEKKDSISVCPNWKQGILSGVVTIKNNSQPWISHV